MRNIHTPCAAASSNGTLDSTSVSKVPRRRLLSIRGAARRSRRSARAHRSARGEQPSSPCPLLHAASTWTSSSLEIAKSKANAMPLPCSSRAARPSGFFIAGGRWIRCSRNGELGIDQRGRGGPGDLRWASALASARCASDGVVRGDPEAGGGRATAGGAVRCRGARQASRNRSKISQRSRRSPLEVLTDSATAARAFRGAPC